MLRPGTISSCLGHLVVPVRALIFPISSLHFITQCCSAVRYCQHECRNVGVSRTSPPTYPRTLCERMVLPRALDFASEPDMMR